MSTPTMATAQLEAALALALGEADGVPFEANLADEIEHLLEASQERCSYNEGDYDLPPGVQERIEAAYRTARLVRTKVRALVALHGRREQERAAGVPAVTAAPRPEAQ